MYRFPELEGTAYMTYLLYQKYIIMPKLGKLHSVFDDFIITLV